MELQPADAAAACRLLNCESAVGLVGLTRTAIMAAAGIALVQNFQPLRRDFHVQARHAGDVASWPVSVCRPVPLRLGRHPSRRRSGWSWLPILPPALRERLPARRSRPPDELTSLPPAQATYRVDLPPNEIRLRHFGPRHLRFRRDLVGRLYTAGECGWRFGPRYPITGNARCCARAGSGHAPRHRGVMNSRRLITRSPRRRGRAAEAVMSRPSARRS